MSSEGGGNAVAVYQPLEQVKGEEKDKKRNESHDYAFIHKMNRESKHSYERKKREKEKQTYMAVTRIGWLILFYLLASLSLSPRALFVLYSLQSFPSTFLLLFSLSRYPKYLLRAQRSASTRGMKECGLSMDYQEEQ